ncbi:prepilin-type N-terminal cleavage/methylation domain-containing protein [Thermus sp.]|uniref:prepilin-type N-terminal cleavage/methylation domain-containing protein n=1 Tax=Thermus sp. TaxID=275 RepID=UPI00307FC14F
MRTTKGFALVELLVALVIVLLLLSLLYLAVTPTRKKANLIAGQTYARSVATDLEALREPSTGALPQNLTDCTQGFGAKPSTVVECTISYPDPTNFSIRLRLKGATHSEVVYDGATGTLAVRP